MKTKHELLSRLRCPITKSRLRVMRGGEIDNINKKILKKKQCHLDGSLVKKTIRRGLISSDGNYVYPIIDGIIILDSDLLLVVDDSLVKKTIGVKTEKETVVNFYNQIGWKKANKDVFVDAARYEDLRPVVKDYIHKCHLRVNRYLKSRGDFLLDAGSGPIQYEEYFTYSKNYKCRVCVDISFLALKEAKKRLGSRGIYILADLTNLPFMDNSFDGTVSLHVIYHIAMDQQKNAIGEIYRTLKKNSRAVIVYSSPAGFRLLPLVGKIARKLKIVRRPIVVPKSDFYFQPLNYKSFMNQNRKCKMEIFVWRSVSVLFTRRYIHSWLFGKLIMFLIFKFEEAFPHLSGRIGQYPLFVLKK